MIRKITSEGETLAVILSDAYDEKGLNFINDLRDSFQVGFHNVAKGKRYSAHKSKPFQNIHQLITNKIYYIKEGKVGVDIYDKNNQKIEYVVLNQGDLILFTAGAHGLDILENSKVIEIKQGPYRGTESDKEFIE